MQPVLLLDRHWEGLDANRVAQVRLHLHVPGRLAVQQYSVHLRQPNLRGVTSLRFGHPLRRLLQYTVGRGHHFFLHARNNALPVGPVLGVLETSPSVKEEGRAAHTSQGADPGELPR